MHRKLYSGKEVTGLTSARLFFFLRNSPVDILSKKIKIWSVVFDIICSDFLLNYSRPASFAISSPIYCARVSIFSS